MCEFCTSEYHLSNFKWGTGEYGTPGGQVYWSFATSPGNGFGFSDFITDSTYKALIRDAFQAWENVADIDFVEVTDGSQTQLHLGWDVIDGPFSVVGEASTRGSRSTDELFSITESEIRFDVEENWARSKTAGFNEVGLYQVALHEIGHAIGLNHTESSDTIMFASNISGIPGLTAGDIEGAQLMYGAAGGSSNTPPPTPDPEPEPDPVTPEPDPVEPDPVPPVAAPVRPDPEPVTPTPVTPAPVTPTPVVPTPDPVSPVPTGRGPTSDPVAPEPYMPTQSSDIFVARAGNDVINGMLGDDTLQLSGTQSEYTLTLSSGNIVLTDRAGRDGSDTLISIERLEFQPETTGASSVIVNLANAATTGSVFTVDTFDGVTTLDADEFSQIVELYIAYFNRAPDAVGLAFWGNAFADGLSMEEMAALFIDQDETRDTYPDSLSNEDFATAVYTNVLGRVPDAEGFDFWVNVLNEGSVARPTFILSVLEGAKAAVPADASAGFIVQVLEDRQYLSDKADIGAYFAVHKGMSDVDDAAQAMALFDGSQGSIQMAINAIENHHADALSSNGGDFLLPLMGVLDDPFSA